MQYHRIRFILLTTYFSMFALLAGGQNAFAAQGQDLPNSIFALTALEQAQKRGQMRRACINLSRKVATFSYAQQEMQGGGTHPITFEEAYQKCLTLSDDETSYVPDNRTLTDALYKEPSKKPAVPTAKVVAFTIKTSPPKANIRILNIAPPYQAGIKVPTGLYHIVIQKPGFQKWDKWLKVTDKHAVFHARLTPQKQIIAQKKVSKPEKTTKTLQTAKITIKPTNETEEEKAEQRARLNRWVRRVVAQQRAQEAASLAAEKAKVLRKGMAAEIAAKEREVAAMEQAERQKYERAIAEGRTERERRLAKLKAMTIKTSLAGY